MGGNAEHNLLDAGTAFFQGSFVTSLPSQTEACRGTTCETLTSWDADGYEKFPVFQAPACLTPGLDYPSLYRLGSQDEPPAWRASGRFVSYRLPVPE